MPASAKAYIKALIARLKEPECRSIIMSPKSI